MKQGWKSTSKRWNNKDYFNNNNYNNDNDNNVEGSCWKQMYGYSNNYYNNSNKMMVKKRVMVIVDETRRAKDATMWALSNVTNKGDWLTLLHIVSNNNTNHHYCNTSSPNYLVTSLASLCKASKPEVEVEALVIQGPKLETVLSQVKKLEVSVLVLGQKKPSSIMSCLFGMSNSEEFVKQCINNAECLTIGVKKQSKGMGGFLISTRWQKNFWLLA